MILKALNNKKVTQPNPEEISFFFKDIIEMLGFISSTDHDVQNSATLCMSKLLLAIGCYLPPSNDKLESYKVILEAIRSKLEIKDIVSLFTSNLVSSLVNSKNIVMKLILIEEKEAFQGLNEFFSLIHEECSKEIRPSYNQYLDSFFGMLDELNAEEKTLNEFEKLKETEIVGNIVKLMKMDLQEILNILLKRRPEFPLAPSISKCLQKVIQDKTLLAKMFNYLTDIINNPEQG